MDAPIVDLAIAPLAPIRRTRDYEVYALRLQLGHQVVCIALSKDALDMRARPGCSESGYAALDMPVLRYPA